MFETYRLLGQAHQATSNAKPDDGHSLAACDGRMASPHNERRGNQ
jgi:hypothetical protein